MGMTRFDTPGSHAFKAVKVSGKTKVVSVSKPQKRYSTGMNSKKKTKKIGQPSPARSILDSIIPGAAFLPGGSAAGATQIVTENPDIIIGSIFPPAAVIGGPLETPGYKAGKAYDELVVQQVKEDPEIPQEFKNQFERDHIETYAKFEKDVVALPGKVVSDIKLPEIKLPELPNLLPDFSGVGKWLLIGGAILAALLILPALLGRRAVKSIA